MAKFNDGKSYHGSDALTHGKLRGATAETDYFYFFCPKCEGEEVLRILEYGIHAQEAENPYNEKCKSTAKYGFTLVFKVHCDECKYSDVVKISNTGWQGGQLREILHKA